MKRWLYACIVMSGCATTQDYHWICKSDKTHCAEFGYELPLSYGPYALWLKGRELCPHGVAALARDLSRETQLIICR